jgi:hypothetical protein
MNRDALLAALPAPRDGGGAGEIACFATRLGLTVTAAVVGIEYLAHLDNASQAMGFLQRIAPARAYKAASGHAAGSAKSSNSAATSGAGAGVMRRHGSR